MQRMKRIMSICIEFKNDNTLYIQDVVDYHIEIGYLDIYVYDEPTKEDRHYHIDMSEIRYYEKIRTYKEDKA